MRLCEREERETWTLKTESEPELLKLFLVGGMADWSRQTMDSHWFRFKESPTNISLFPLNFSSNSFALNLCKNQWKNKPRITNLTQETIYNNMSNYNTSTEYIIGYDLMLT